jgi:hypothetical protein
VKHYLPRHIWTPAEVDVLQKRYASEDTAEIAKLIGVTPYQVFTKASSLGIRKTKKFLRALGQAMADRAPESVKKTRFQPGHPAWNKGKKFQSRGQMAETQFKLGAKPHSYAQIGSERQSKEGYLQRKLTDTGYPPSDWVPVHHIVWMEAGNQRPKRSEVLVFRDGNKRNFSLANLELISRKELMCRNSVHRHGSGITMATQLRGALNRIIKRRMEA